MGSLPHLSIPALVFAGAVLFALHQIYLWLTTAAHRRRLIRENGCEPVYAYPHKGILGKLIGLDVIKENIQAGKEGRMHEAIRLRNWSDGRKTVKLRVLRNRREFAKPLTGRLISPCRRVSWYVLTLLGA